MKIRYCLLLSGLLCFNAGVANSQPGFINQPHMTRSQAQTPGPARILRQGVGKLIQFMKRPDRPTRKQRIRFVEEEIAPYFDFRYMAKWAAGPSWRYMDERRKTGFEERLREHFLTTLVQKLGNYSSQRMRVLRPSSRRGGDVTVTLAIQNPQGYPARMDFRFYRSSNDWKIFDVTANGSSALMFYRNHFRQESRHRRGPSQYRLR